MTAPALDFWFDFASTYSYPAAMRLRTLASAAGVEVKFRPFLLGPIFKAQGWTTSPFDLFPKIVTNQCLVHLRRSSLQRCVSLDHSLPGSAPPVVVDQAPSPEQLVRSAEIHQKIIDTVGRLPRHLRDVFVLSKISGLSIAETAKALGLTIPATKTRIFRARSFMRFQLRDMRGKTDGNVATLTPKQRLSDQRSLTSTLAAA